jgi:hypothetical protein
LNLSKREVIDFVSRLYHGAFDVVFEPPSAADGCRVPELGSVDLPNFEL